MFMPDDSLFMRKAAFSKISPVFFTSYWPVLYHVATPSHREAWKIESFSGTHYNSDKVKFSEVKTNKKK